LIEGRNIIYNVLEQMGKLLRFKYTIAFKFSTFTGIFENHLRFDVRPQPQPQPQLRPQQPQNRSRNSGYGKNIKKIFLPLFNMKTLKKVWGTILVQKHSHTILV
jgi:hypothetical protein